MSLLVPIPRPVRLVFTVLLVAPFSSAGVVDARGTWRSAQGEINAALVDYRRFDRDRADEDAYRPLVDRFKTALETALSSDTSGPPLVKRIQTVLPRVADWPPEVHHLIYGVFSKVVGAALQRLEGDQLDALDEYARELWKARTKRAAEKTTLERMIVASSLAKLIEESARRPLVVDLTRHLLERELFWIKAISKKPLTLAKAIKVLGTQPETATMYPVLDAVEAVRQSALRGEVPVASLEPFVDHLIEILEKTEVRVEGEKRGEVLAADDRRAASQFRLWFHVTDILQEWTGERQYVWAADWRKFWQLYSGPRPVQGHFDFAAVKEGARGAGGSTVVVSKEDAFFGLETRTSKFLIVLDVSTSMVENSQNINRFVPLKLEAIRFIKSLRPGVHYNILPFSSTCEIEKSLTGSHALQPKRRPQGQIDERVRKWILGLKTEAFTRVDLAFRTAFDAPEGTSRRRRASGPMFNEIYFITDGSPTNAEKRLMNSTERLDLLSLIRALNARYRVIIHTVGFPRMEQSFIRQLALENGGRCITVRF